MSFVQMRKQLSQKRHSHANSFSGHANDPDFRQEKAEKSLRLNPTVTMKRQILPSEGRECLCPSQMWHWVRKGHSIP